MSDELRFERIVGAPIDVVFDLFTTPAGQEAFYGRDEPGWITESSCELRVGGVWTITFGSTGSQLNRHRHLFTMIEPPRRLVLATTEFRADGSTLDFTTEFQFAPHPGGTLMTMLQTGLPTHELRDEHSRGLPQAFDRLRGALVSPPPVVLFTATDPSS